MFLNDIKYNWIGDIPKNWEVKRIKNLFYLKKEVSENPEQEQVLSLTMNGIIKRDVSSNEGQLPDTYKGYTKIYPDDIVMNPMDLRSGWIDRSKYNGIISPSYYVLNKLNNNLDIQFFTYQLQRHYKEKIFFSFGQGVSYDYRWGLGRETILNFPIVVPPLEIQTHIVSFLDTKTQKIDELIEKTEKKIKLLKEKRTSLINHCVTKGLNPDVEMKDSGVEWIGEIPMDWDLIRLKYFFSLEGGKDSKNIQKDDGQYPILGTGGEINRGSDFLYDKPTLLLGRKGTIDKPFLFEEPFWVSDVMYYTIQKKDITPKYLFLLFKLIPFEYFKYGSTQPSMSRLDYESMLFPIPPIKERTLITEYIDEQTQKIDSNIKKETQRIELLKEYRQSLISEVVTGKVDVRDWKE